MVENDMDGEALATLIGLTPGPDCLKDLVKKVGWRLKVYKAIKELYEGENINVVIDNGVWVPTIIKFFFVYRRIIIAFQKALSPALSRSAVALVLSVIRFVMAISWIGISCHPLKFFYTHHYTHYTFCLIILDILTKKKCAINACAKWCVTQNHSCTARPSAYINCLIMTLTANSCSYLDIRM